VVVYTVMIYLNNAEVKNCFVFSTVLTYVVLPEIHYFSNC